MGEASPYATGGGGTVLEHRYGALLLTHLLTGDPLTELGDDATPVEITFQASSFSAVDDVVVKGLLEDGTKRQVSIGVRRSPSFVPSDGPSVDLIRSYLCVLHDRPLEIASGEWRLALTVASPNTHVQQMRELANIARDVIDEEQFRAEVARPGRTTHYVRDRLRHLDRLVAAAAHKTDFDTKLSSTSRLTWLLLAALRLRELRLEGIDETDRSSAVARLRGHTKAGSADAASKLFSRLAELVGRYAPAAATKNNTTLRRDLNGELRQPPAHGSNRYDASVQDSQDAAATYRQARTESAPEVRSEYLSQVRRIAPRDLLSREHEVSHLAEFCTALESDSYLWLRAPAWAGKSALLSSFTLNPPPGIQVVSFFITARLAGQGDRNAFADVVLEQALEITGEPMPVLLSDATREAHLLASLTRAAQSCQDKGERLVLVVDGLDEDLGVTTGPDAHSIAAMLPADPPGGMRVIVSGRPNPPIPSDVADDHPLRRPTIIRTLPTSPHAEVVRQDAERELKRLLRGTAAEQDLLGILATAGGGLSGDDLAELTGLSAWEIEDHLTAVSGRTFSPRVGRWRPNTTVYLLAHEELQQQAESFIGANRLELYREMLHSWADKYRDQDWPIDTPEYLLRGYFRLLISISDVRRMVAYATDAKRHDRMLDVIGGDIAALTEITLAQEALASQPVPNLVQMTRLALHRAKLVERNENLPVNLPGVWVQLGSPSRAEALARSITNPSRRVRALAAVVHELVVANKIERAKIIGSQAEQAITSVTDPFQRANGYAVVARAFAEAKDPRANDLIVLAEESANLLADPPQQAAVLAVVARAVAVLGEASRARDIANSISTWSERAQALAAVAIEIANTGRTRLGLEVASAISNRTVRAQALADVARTAKQHGDDRASVDIVERAAVTAREIGKPERQASALVSVAYAMALIGQSKEAQQLLVQAERLATSVIKQSERENISIAIARVVAIVGDLVVHHATLVG
ncbi:hypothetical protein [Spongiactinospora sp. TRM90649]|uniref:hypothetical protein n=1 Tax=Spongiactinospora sp. TRM90649 TaxID=3031114 RepID=UPI0023F795A2|nr:hypothetical protein [Spongiactinospora sp. TRM90649]MDF5755052.1 hypothetical protein [Spongiactinospora sp. TRM90649]